MAIRLVDGVPGSGKTYYVVHHIVDKYKDKLGEVQVYANIESLVIPHIDLQEHVDKSTAEKVFTVPYFEKLIHDSGKEKHLIIIDEAQKFFHKKFYCQDVFYFFQYHRHLGLDIYIVTQSEKLIPIQIVSMAETVIHAQPRSVSLLGELKYVTKVAGENVDRMVLKPDQKIYDLYRSMSKKEGEKPKNVFKKYLVGMALIGIAAPLIFWYTFLYHPKAESSVKPETKASSSTAARPSSSAPIAEDKPGPIRDRLPETEKRIAVVISYVLGPNSELLLVEPITNTLLPTDLYPYPFHLLKNKGSLYITAYFPRQKYEAMLKAREEEEQKGRAGQAAHTLSSNSSG